MHLRNTTQVIHYLLEFFIHFDLIGFSFIYFFIHFDLIRFSFIYYEILLLKEALLYSLICTFK
jgi:hypothetical protein